MPNAAFTKSLKTEHQPKKGLHQSSHNPLNETSTKTVAPADMVLRPTHFLVRPRLSPEMPATCVPLIPIDLLPELLELAGVPRQLSAAQAAGMHNVGTYERPGDCYKVRILAMPTSKAPAPPADPDEMTSTSSRSTSDGEASFGLDSTGTGSMSQPSSDSDDNKGVAVKGGKKKAAKAKAQQAQTGNTTKTKTAAPSPSAAERILASASTASAHHLAPSKKNKKEKQQAPKPAEPAPSTSATSSSSDITPASPPPAPSTKGNYCRHYCLHGNCRWGNTCRYRHEMPTTLEGLQAVGLRDWPQWFLAMMRMVQDGRLAAQVPVQVPVPMSMSPFAAPAQHNPFMGMMGMSPFGGVQGTKSQVPAAEKKRREERQVRRAEERMRELEMERAEGEKSERVRVARASKLSAAHAVAAKAALGEGEEMMLVDV
jgi:hypothetical protein